MEVGVTEEARRSGTLKVDEKGKIRRRFQPRERKEEKRRKEKKRKYTIWNLMESI